MRGGPAPRGPTPSRAGGARSGGARPAGGRGHAGVCPADGRAGGGRHGADGTGRATHLRGVAGAAGGGPMTPGAAAARPMPGARARLAGPRPGGRPRRSTRVLAGLVLAAVLSTRWVRLNVSGSLPYGLYRLVPVPQPLPRDTIVLLPVPET